MFKGQRKASAAGNIQRIVNKASKLGMGKSCWPSEGYRKEFGFYSKSDGKSW